jgi:hypothetical protein
VVRCSAPPAGWGRPLHSTRDHGDAHVAIIKPDAVGHPVAVGRWVVDAGAAGVLLPSGENHYYGGRRDLVVGNTELLARMIAGLIDCDVYRIEAADPYPVGYDANAQRNVTEQDSAARPTIACPRDSIAGLRHGAARQRRTRLRRRLPPARGIGDGLTVRGE